MADLERENIVGYTDRRASAAVNERGDTGSDDKYKNFQVATSSDMSSVGGLRTYLAASTLHGAGFYTPARLNNMTKNDMVYAARLIADAAGI